MTASRCQSWQFINSPLTGFYNLFGKTPGSKARLQHMPKNEHGSSAVDKRYTKELVKSITKLPDDEVDKFMAVLHPRTRI